MQRRIAVNVQPLDAIVQNAIAQSMQRGAEDSFGHKYVTPVSAMVRFQRSTPFWQSAA